MSFDKRVNGIAGKALVLRLLDVVKDWSRDDVSALRKIIANPLASEDEKQLLEDASQKLQEPLGIFFELPYSDRQGIMAQLVERRDNYQAMKKMKGLYEYERPVSRN